MLLVFEGDEDLSESTGLAIALTGARIIHILQSNAVI